MLKKVKSFVKDLLAIPLVDRLYKGWNLVVLSIFGSNRIFASLYTLLGFMTFNREQYAVLRGRRDYYRNLKRVDRTHVGLRRNIHRLEKGMIMRPRRDIFARDYISETVQYYEAFVDRYIADSSSVDIAELDWATDILSEYFKIVANSDSTINKLRSKFVVVSKDIETKSEKLVPYEASRRTVHSVEYDDLYELALHRRSVRWFTKDKVSRTDVEKAMEVAALSPTACNRLPYEFKYFDDPELVSQIADIPFGAGGYSHQIPSIVVVVGKLDSYFSPRDRHAIYIDSSLAAMSFIYALETLKLSSTIINWPDFEPLEVKMQRQLGLKTSERVIMLIAIGHADPTGGVPSSKKKSIESTLTFNRDLR